MDKEKEKTCIKCRRRLALQKKKNEGTDYYSSRRRRREEERKLCCLRPRILQQFTLFQSVINITNIIYGGAVFMLWSIK